jgi:hypothetical protein
VTDVGLELAVGWPHLQAINLINCRVSRTSCEQLKAAMPNAKVYWSEPNSLAAERVLALGGRVDIAPLGKEACPVKPGDPLPRGFFQLRRVSLREVKQPLGELPATLALLSFAELDRLEAIDLTGTPLQDIGFLASIQGLQDLTLAKTEIGDDQLGALPRVKRLVLDDNPIRGPGLIALRDQPDLAELSLARTPISDLSVKNVAALKRLKRLSLAGTAVSDAGLRHLEGLMDLQKLDLTGTKVTAAGVAGLQKSLAKCKIVGPARQ